MESIPGLEHLETTGIRDEDTTRGSRGSFVPLLVGIFLFAAGAADGHDLAVSARDADWPLLIRADLELLGGLWLLSGRFARGARIAAIAVCGVILAYDLSRAAAGYPSRDLFGRVVVGRWWVLLGDLLIFAGLLCWRPAAKPSPQMDVHPRRLAATLLVAGLLGVAIDRSQVGQFPIITTARSGRSASGLDYLVYLPDGYYRSSRRWPLILALHGRGEAGEDIGRLRGQGLSRRVEEKGGLPFVIVAPQCGDWAWNPAALDRLLDEVLKRYRIDADRVYLVGNSMGGNGTWAWAAHSPDRFAAIAPICGRGEPAWARRLKGIPTWAFHGADDRIVPPEQSERMIEALKEAGGDARLTLYPGVGHDSWTPTYANPRFYEWLLQHRRGSDREF
jgi:pimeloyl-ACP methyl ester carboxylesterase